MKKTLLLVFIHGFKGSDGTFAKFPTDLRALLSHALPKIEIISEQYPQFETRGDLKECVAKFKEWLQNKVIDLEVANGTPSPTVDPSVRVVLVGHSMGGIVAAETLLSVARDEPVEDATSGSTKASSRPHSPTRGGLEVPKQDQRSSSAPPSAASTNLFFPFIQGILAFDTPYLGISPGVLAHGAEEHFNNASAAYKAYNGASQLFGFNRSSSPQPIANASSRGLPAAEQKGWGKWGKYAMYGGAAAALAGAAGAAYLNWNQINQGFAWAGSHLEFVGCLARGAELQKRVESIVELTETHHLGFANFYCALGEKVTSKTQYAGAIVGQDRTFCVVPKGAKGPDSPTGSKRAAAPSPNPPPKASKRQKTGNAEIDAEMKEGEQVQEFAQDASKSKGKWIKCINAVASDELRGHTSMFSAQKNSGYHAMLPQARNTVASWIDNEWYETSNEDEAGDEMEEVNGGDVEEEEQADAGAEVEAV